MLTGLEEKILQCITRYITQNGRSPTLDEIGQLLEIRSKGTIHRYVKSLIDKGHLQRSGRNWRGLRLAGEQNRRLTILPLAGRIAAGKPIEAISEQYEINFSEMLLGPGRYVLEVQGDSMIDAGILDGDLVIVRETQSADNGDIIVALIDNNEATLKRLRKKGNQVELIPDNQSMTPMIYSADRINIQGVVVGQARMY
ncbi:MAG TPA: transcriptional repressor LexA [Gammaproteobacteria bacterium]|jgi:repressor LexA|nr:transcriptional repressor LexA [Gammaproteobacteria bacterium]|tara:strand:+ start:3712 stop:4305 length:594 start_codon:yes stop_codon:yes gene_type:complete